jgi:hypothetical protein
MHQSTASDLVEKMACVGYPLLFSGVRYLALLQAYCDESTHKDEIFTVAGWVATKDEWKILAEKWEARLARNGLTYFHATDCAGGFNDFAHLSKPERESLDTDLIGYMTERQLVGFAVSVSWSDFLNLIQEDPHAKEYLNSDPYFIATQLIVISICNAVKDNAPQNYDIAFFFEQNEKVSGQAKQIYDDLRRKDASIAPYMGTLTYGEKRKMPPLQVADELAFEAAKNVQAVLDGRKDRRPIERMIEAKILYRSDLLTLQGMKDFVQKMDRSTMAIGGSMPTKPEEMPEEYARFQDLLRKVVKPDPKIQKPVPKPAKSKP